MHEENKQISRNIEFTTNKNSAPSKWLLGMFLRNQRKSKNLNLANLCDLIQYYNEPTMESKTR
jgi:hypothetical protein